MPALASRRRLSKACAMKGCCANCLSDWASWAAPRSIRIFITWSMLHLKATIERLPAKSFVDEIGIGTLFKSALNRRSLETTIEWGEKLKRQHRPADLLALPYFMRPRELTKAAMTAPSLSPSAPKFTATAPAPPAEPAKRLVCARCDVKISFAEGKFC